MISCDKLGKQYGSRWLFRNLSLTVSPGECLVVLGSNGAGKSTLLKVLAGLVPATEGTRSLDGDVRTTLGYAALDMSVYPTLTVREHLTLAADLRGCQHRADELLAEVGLAYAAEQPARSLSTGMRARLKLALAFQANPKVVLLDEPGAGLDAAGLAVLERLIESRLPTTGFLLATNDPQERRFATHELQLDA